MSSLRLEPPHKGPQLGKGKLNSSTEAHGPLGCPLVSALRTLEPKAKFWVRRGGPGGMNKPHHPDSPWVQLRPVFNEAGGTDLGAKPMARSAPQSSQQGYLVRPENWTFWLQDLTHDSSSLDKAPGNLAGRRAWGWDAHHFCPPPPPLLGPLEERRTPPEAENSDWLHPFEFYRVCKENKCV